YGSMRPWRAVAATPARRRSPSTSRPRSRAGARPRAGRAEVRDSRRAVRGRADVQVGPPRADPSLVPAPLSALTLRSPGGGQAALSGGHEAMPHDHPSRPGHDPWSGLIGKRVEWTESRTIVKRGWIWDGSETTKLTFTGVILDIHTAKYQGDTFITYSVA